MATTTDQEPIHLIELYATHNMMNAQLVIDLLKAHEVRCAARTNQPAQFPLNIGDHGEHRLLVASDQIDEAVALIKQAIEDGAIDPKESEFLA